MSFVPAEGIRRYKPPVEDSEPDFIEPEKHKEKENEEEKEEEEEVEEIKTPPSSYNSVWIVMIILILCNVIGIIYFVPVCLSASAKMETSHLLQHYKLWTSVHDTVSTEINLYQGKDREIASILQSALAANGAGHACICMHHLALSAEYGSRRACMVHGILMLNPELKGASTSTNMWRQWSVSCQKNPIERKRYQSIYLEWDDIQTNEKHWIRFNGIESACMQLAMEEMDGKVQCSD